MRSQCHLFWTPSYTCMYIYIVYSYIYISQKLVFIPHIPIYLYIYINKVPYNAPHIYRFYIARTSHLFPFQLNLRKTYTVYIEKIAHVCEYATCRICVCVCTFGVCTAHARFGILIYCRVFCWIYFRCIKYGCALLWIFIYVGIKSN